jgi:hypothetical protein
MSADIGIKGLKREHKFIKNHVPGDVDATLGNIKTLEPLVDIFIAKKSTLDRTKLKFMGIIHTKVWPTGTIEDT